MYHLIILAAKFIHNVEGQRQRQVYARLPGTARDGPSSTGVGMRGRGEGQVFSRYL